MKLIKCEKSNECKYSKCNHYRDILYYFVSTVIVSIAGILVGVLTIIEGDLFLGLSEIALILFALTGGVLKRKRNIILTMMAFVMN